MLKRRPSGPPAPLLILSLVVFSLTWTGSLSVARTEDKSSAKLPIFMPLVKEDVKVIEEEKAVEATEGRKIVEEPEKEKLKQEPGKVSPAASIDEGGSPKETRSALSPLEIGLIATVGVVAFALVVGGTFFAILKQRNITEHTPEPNTVVAQPAHSKQGSNADMKGASYTGSAEAQATEDAIATEDAFATDASNPGLPIPMQGDSNLETASKKSSTESQEFADTEATGASSLGSPTSHSQISTEFGIADNQGV